MRDSNFKQVQYNITIDLLQINNMYYATQSITCICDSYSALSQVVILTEQTNIDILTVEVNHDSECELRDGLLIVNLKEPIKLGDFFTISFNYNAKLPGSVYWNDYFQEFAGEKSWYPRLAVEPILGCDYDVLIHAPESMSVYGTGQRIGKRFVGKSIQNFGFIASEKFLVIEKKTQDIDFVCLYPPGSEMLAKGVIDTAIEAAMFYHELLGFYPCNSFTAVPGAEYYVGGCPIATGMVHLHGMQRTKNSFDYDNCIVAHEIAHQYFGDTYDYKSPSWVWLGLGLSLDYEFMLKTNKSMGQYEKYYNYLNEAIKLGKADIPFKKEELMRRIADT
ncbi:hypothetical protein JYG23_03055 [Sedimentibacter sp. zth1]|uniref:hypothetical protein n=1 Tax=Sedimentibacter sp. zth1 TaxID=2816908 RepID=UPI001A9111CB|nr:hypothetical protein [Sedimentibacter sp. zth1]QSX06453.1 hypothetical protein JYG23_03055 [Sedimentibacter sp. zth1]